MTSVLHDAGIGVDRGYLVDRRHRDGPTGGRRGGRLWRKLYFGHRQRSRRQIHCGAPPGRARIRSSWPPRLEQQPDEYANHSTMEKKQWYCRQDVLGTGQ